MIKYKILVRYKLKARKEMVGYSLHAFLWRPIHQWDDEKGKWIIETWPSYRNAKIFAKKYCHKPYIKYKIKEMK